jgi:signal transduction histidine kinase
MRKLLLLLLLLSSCWLHAQDSLLRSTQASLPFIKDSVVYVNALNKIAYLIHQKDTDSCLYYAYTANAIAARNNYKKGVGQALSMFAIASFFKSDYKTSFVYKLKAEAIFIELKDTLNLCLTYSRLAYLLKNDSKPEDAKLYATKARQLAWQFTYDSIKPHVYNNYVYSHLNNLKAIEARRMLDTAQAIARTYKDEKMVVRLIKTRSLTYQAEGNYDAAITLLKKTVPELQQKSLLSDLTESEFELGENYFFKKDTQQSLQHYTLAYNLALRTNYEIVTLATLKRLVQLYKNKDQLLYNKYSAILINSLIKNREAVIKNDVSYVDYLVKEKELGYLKTAAALQKRRTLLLVAVSILCFLLSIIVLLLFRLSKKNEATLKKLNEVGQEKNTLLQEADHFRTKLLSLMAHDYRTPFITMATYSAHLKKEIPALNEEQTFLINHIEKECIQNLTVFENTLIWLRRQLAGTTQQIETKPLFNLVHAALHVLEPLREEKNIQTKIEIHPEIVITADIEMLQFVHRNFLHNAIKHSPNNGLIKVTVRRTIDAIELQVADEGPGLTNEDLKTVFSLTEKRLKSKKPGMGLALFLCKDFIEKMNGRIGVRNNSDKGAVFFYSLPTR